MMRLKTGIKDLPIHVVNQIVERTDGIPLFVDAAYESQSRKKRQYFHERIAGVLYERFPATAEQQPQLLAHHFTEAGNVAQAIAYWQKAGERSQKRSANAEAIAQLGKGVKLLRTLEESTERDQQELGLLVPLGVVWMATPDWASEQRQTTLWNNCVAVGSQTVVGAVLLQQTRADNVSRSPALFETTGGTASAVCCASGDQVEHRLAQRAKTGQRSTSGRLIGGTVPRLYCG